MQVSTQDTANVGSQEYGHVPEAVQVWEVDGKPVAAVESVTDPEGHANRYPQQADVAQFPSSAIFAPATIHSTLSFFIAHSQYHYIVFPIIVNCPISDYYPSNTIYIHFTTQSFTRRRCCFDHEGLRIITG